MRGDLRGCGQPWQSNASASRSRPSSSFRRRLRNLCAEKGPEKGTTMRVEHTLPADLAGRKPGRILGVGGGGTGSATAMGLPYLDRGVRVWGRASGIEVVMMDGDAVSETNCVRQPFSASDIGQNKATVLINRINLFWGTSWLAIPN